MEVNTHLITEICQDWGKMLNSVSESSGKCKHIVKSINCGLLDEIYLKQDIRDAEDFKELFNGLNKDAPSLYVFEIVSEQPQSEIKEAFIKYSKKKERQTPAFYKKNKESKILYVGKVSGANLWGRIIYHLGVGEKSQGHGLQLLHWAKSFRLELKLHIFEFEQINNHLLQGLEYQLADQLKPLIGKHL